MKGRGVNAPPPAPLNELTPACVCVCAVLTVWLVTDVY